MTMKDRKTNIELLRLLAMLSIVFMHMCSHGGLVDLTHFGGESFVSVWLMFSPGVHSINLLLLISGYFLCEQKFSSFKIVRLISQVLFYSILITLIFWFFLGGERDPKYLLYSILPITSDFYWYPSIYVGLYLFSPVLNKLINSLSKNQLKMTCILCFLLVSVWPNLAFYSSALNTAGGVSIAWFVCVYLFAAYIRKYYVPNGKWKLKGLISLGLLLLLPLSKFFLEWIMTTPLSKISVLEDLLWGYSFFYSYSSILVTITSIAVFITFLNINISGEKISRCINIAAGASFGVYLIHDHFYVREFLWGKLRLWESLGHWYLVPLCILTAICIYLGGMTIELLRKKLFSLWENNTKFRDVFNRFDERHRNIWRG